MPPAAMPWVIPVLLAADDDCAASIHWRHSVWPIGIIYAPSDQTDEEKNRRSHENSVVRTRLGPTLPTDRR